MMRCQLHNHGVACAVLVTGCGHCPCMHNGSQPLPAPVWCRYEAAIVRLDQARAAQDELEKMYREASKEAALRDAADDEKQASTMLDAFTLSAEPVAGTVAASCKCTG